MLKELLPSGEASFEIDVSYQGLVRVEVGTTAAINLGARLKGYSVDLVLATVLKSLSGTLLIKIKPPPSSRIWYGFVKMPEMDLQLEPVVSQRQITWNLILNPLLNAIKEMVNKTLD